MKRHRYGRMSWLNVLLSEGLGDIVGADRKPQQRPARAPVAMWMSAVLVAVVVQVGGMPAGAGDPDPLTDMQYVRSCNDTSPVSLAVVNEVLVHKRLGPSEQRAFQCFLHCLFTKYGWVSSEWTPGSVDTVINELSLYVRRWTRRASS